MTKYTNTVQSFIRSIVFIFSFLALVSVTLLPLSAFVAAGSGLGKRGFES